MHKLLFEPQMNSIFVISTSNNPIINKIYARTKAGMLTDVAPPPPRSHGHLMARTAMNNIRNHFPGGRMGGRPELRMHNDEDSADFLRH